MVLGGYMSGFSPLLFSWGGGLVGAVMNDPRRSHVCTTFSFSSLVLSSLLLGLSHG